MKILMTGGTGFGGSYLAERLIRDGHEVTIGYMSYNGVRKKLSISAYERLVAAIGGGAEEK